MLRITDLLHLSDQNYLCHGPQSQRFLLLGELHGRGGLCTQMLRLPQPSTQSSTSTYSSRHAGLQMRTVWQSSQQLEPPQPVLHPSNSGMRMQLPVPQPGGNRGVQPYMESPPSGQINTGPIIAMKIPDNWFPGFEKIATLCYNTFAYESEICA